VVIAGFLNHQQQMELAAEDDAEVMLNHHPGHLGFDLS